MSDDIEVMRLNIISHVKNYMRINNIHFAEVAKRLEMGKSTAWRICFDQVTNPQLKTLIKISSTLGVSLTTLLETSSDEE